MGGEDSQSIGPGWCCQFPFSRGERNGMHGGLHGTVIKSGASITLAPCEEMAVRYQRSPLIMLLKCAVGSSVGAAA